MESQDIEWEPIVTPGLTAETISGIAIQKKADLTISATHGRSGLKRFLLGSVTERLFRIIPCPLLIVPPPEHLSDTLSLEKIRFKKIVVGCDFSADSEMALNYV